MSALPTCLPLCLSLLSVVGSPPESFAQVDFPLCQSCCWSRQWECYSNPIQRDCLRTCRPCAIFSSFVLVGAEECLLLTLRRTYWSLLWETSGCRSSDINDKMKNSQTSCQIGHKNYQYPDLFIPSAPPPCSLCAVPKILSSSATCFFNLSRLPANRPTSSSLAGGANNSLLAWLLELYCL